MNIEFKCPQCGKPVTADESLRGSVVECPHCERGIVVPRSKQILRPHVVEDTSTQSHAAIHEKTRRVSRPSTTIDEQAASESIQIKPSPTFKERSSPTLKIETTETTSLSSHSLENPTGEKPFLSRFLRNVGVICVILIVAVIGGFSPVLYLEMTRQDVPEQFRQSSEHATVLMTIEKLEKVIKNQKLMMDKIEETQKAINQEIMAIKQDIPKAISDRIAISEDGNEQNYEDLVKLSNRCIEKCDSILERIEVSAKQTERVNVASSIRQQRQVEQQPRQHEIEIPKPTKLNDAHKESVAELQHQLEMNLIKIKQLIQENPACFLNPDKSKIVNISQKIAQKGDAAYCRQHKITFVRDQFYCTGCKRTSIMHSSPCCKVSQVQSFNAWKKARENVNVTARINGQLLDLRRENASLNQRIRAIKEKNQ